MNAQAASHQERKTTEGQKGNGKGNAQKPEEPGAHQQPLPAAPTKRPIRGSQPPARPPEKKRARLSTPLRPRRSGPPDHGSDDEEDDEDDREDGRNMPSNKIPPFTVSKRKSPKKRQGNVKTKTIQDATPTLPRYFLRPQVSQE